MLTLCLIGCGGHAHRVYADSIVKYARTVGGIQLAACCDMDGEKAESFRARAGFARCYTDFRAMLDAEKPGAVVLVTPFTHTAQIAVEAIEHGCAVMLEKPPGKNMEDCIAIADAAARHNAINMVAFNRRNAPMVKKITALLYGESPLHVQHIDYQMYRYDRCENHFHTTAIHGIDMIGHIARSAYESLGFAYAPQAAYGEGAENLLLHGRFQNGVTTQQSYCPVSGFIMERLTIAADDVTIYVETPIWHGPDYPGVIKLYKKGSLAQTISGESLCGQALFETDGFFDQLSEFLDCVKSGCYTANDILSAADSVRIADCLAARRENYQA